MSPTNETQAESPKGMVLIENNPLKLGGKYIHYTIIWWYEVFIDIQNNERWGTCWQTKSECRSLRLSWNTKWRLHSFLKFIFPGSLFSSKLRLQIFFNTSLATFKASCSLFASVFLHYQTYPHDEILVVYIWNFGQSIGRFLLTKLKLPDSALVCQQGPVVQREITLSTG